MNAPATSASPTTYSLRILAPGKFQMAKFDGDFNVGAVYELNAKGHGYTCDCPASAKNKLKPCKHQRMMPFMLGAVNLPRFFDPDTGRWHGLLDMAPGEAQEPPVERSTLAEVALHNPTASEVKAFLETQELPIHPVVEALVDREAELVARSTTIPTDAIAGAEKGNLPLASAQPQGEAEPVVSPPPPSNSGMPIVRRRI